MPDTDFEVLDDGRVVPTNSGIWNASKEKKLYESAKKWASKITPSGVAGGAVSLLFTPSPFIYGPEAISGPPPAETELSQQASQAMNAAYEGSPSYLEAGVKDSWYGRNVGTPFRERIVAPIEGRASRGSLFSKLIEKLARKEGQ